MAAKHAHLVTCFRLNHVSFLYFVLRDFGGVTDVDHGHDNHQ
jgi:hypothetical protein